MNGNQSATVADIAGSANSRISSSNASHYWEQSSCAVAITNASQFVSISGLFAFPFGELFWRSFLILAAQTMANIIRKVQLRILKKIVIMVSQCTSAKFNRLLNRCSGKKWSFKRRFSTDPLKLKEPVWYANVLLKQLSTTKDKGWDQFFSLQVHTGIPCDKERNF